MRDRTVHHRKVHVKLFPIYAFSIGPGVTPLPTALVYMHRTNAKFLKSFILCIENRVVHLLLPILYP